MLYVVAVFGVLMCAAGVVGLVLPASLTRLASRVAASRPLRIMVVALRIIFGAIVIIAANATAYPLTMKIIGVVAIMAGTLVGFAGGEALQRWIDKIKNHHLRARLMSLAALLFGAFLIHAVS